MMLGGEMERVRGVGVLSGYVLRVVVNDGWMCGMGVVSGRGDSGDVGGGLGLVELSMRQARVDVMVVRTERSGDAGV